MQEQKLNILREKLSGKYTDADTLYEKINKQIESGAIKVDTAPLSPMYCLTWDITYKIYDCLYENEPLTPAEIVPLVNHEKPEAIVNHTLECMGDIGITKPINHENLTSADRPKEGLSILSILHQIKKWTLTEYIKS